MKKTHRIILIAALVAIVCAVYLGRKAYLDEYQKVVQSYKQETKLASAKVDLMFEEIFETFDKEVSQMEAFLAERQRSDDEITEYLRDRTRYLSTAVDPMYVDLYGGFHGKYLCGNYWQPPSTFNIKVRPWYIKALEGKGKSTMVPPYAPADYPHQMIAVSRKLSYPDTVLSVDVQLTAFEPMWRKALKGKVGYEIFVSPEGSVISSDELPETIEAKIKNVCQRISPTETTPTFWDNDIIFHNCSYYGWRSLLILDCDEVTRSAKWAVMGVVMWSLLGFAIVYFVVEILAYRWGFPKVLNKETVLMRASLAPFIVLMVAILFFKVEEAENGAIAVEKVKEKGPGYYDFILMDIQMPVMNGYEATKAIRKLFPDAPLPIIAVSANAFEEDKAASVAAGMNDHVAKPIKCNELFKTIEKYL